LTRRLPSEAEKALWRAAMQDVRPLKKKPAHKPGAKPPALPEFKPATAKPAARPKPKPAAAPPPAPRPASPLPELAHGQAMGLDRRSADRLRRGRLVIDGRLDLHGLTQAVAAQRLAEFIAGGHAAGKRCLLVITGKGLARGGAGVLREQVPRWLNQAPNRAHVLAFTYAQPQHGGMGALYVLLKRRREA
jgi:DNA-nicking Smr family endonuclease